MKCNAQPCPAFWKVSEWSDCKCGSFDELENQTREVKCVQELISGVVIQVNAGACSGRPETSLRCECLSFDKTSMLEVYKQQKKPIKHRKSVKVDDKIKNIQDIKQMGTWLTSDWSEQCSTECGVGSQLRTIFCDRNAQNPDRCDLKATPESTRECTSSAKCAVGDWFIGPWSIVSNFCK